MKSIILTKVLKIASTDDGRVHSSTEYELMIIHQNYDFCNYEWIPRREFQW